MWPEEAPNLVNREEWENVPIRTRKAPNKQKWALAWVKCPFLYHCSGQRRFNYHN